MKTFEVRKATDTEIFRGNDPLRYPFSLTFRFKAGEPRRLEMSAHPEVIVRAQHIVSSVRESGICKLECLTMANMIAVLGSGFDLNCAPEGDDPILGAAIQTEWITPSNRISALVEYSGRLPKGYKGGEVFDVTLTLVCEAKIVT